mgnify:CR=1 FL=1
MKIVVLKGGTSTEREVSLVSGEKIAAGYRRSGHQVLELDTVLPLSQINEEIHITQAHLEHGSKNLVELLQSEMINEADFIFNALHGGFGEDGRIQAVMDMLQLQYNGSGYESSCIAMDKIVSKLLFEKNQVPTPAWLHFSTDEKSSQSDIVKKIRNHFDFPLIVKPANEGSTVGLELVGNTDQLTNALAEAFKYDKNIIVEEFIDGRELTVGLLKNQTFPVLEIKPKHRIYDYECKYTKGMSSYEVPAKLDKSLASQIQKMAQKAYQSLKCTGYGRVDLRLSNNDKPYFLEVNTLPGMTDTSLVPKAAQAAGMNFESLLEKIMEAGINNE